MELLRPGGVFSLLLPSKLWHSLAGGALRRLIVANATLAEIEDLDESPHAFDAAVYPSILVAIRRAARSEPHDPDPLVATITRCSSRLRWLIDAGQLGLDRDTASPWLILPPEVRRSFDRVTAAGTTLAESVFGRSYLGVKCGCNGAFIVTARANGSDPGDDDCVDIEAPGRRARVEAALLRPLLRGESLRAWRVDAHSHNEWILWPHDAQGAVLRALPPHARHWLLPWRRRLVARTDSRGRGHWWTLFRTEGARNDAPRVVWPDLGRSPRAVVLAAGDPAVALNSCYIARAPTLIDAHALAALLNGPLATAWLNTIAEPARGGFRRYLGWTMALLPIPHDWERGRKILAAIGARGCAGEALSAAELLAAALEAYDLAESDAEPLLTWMGR
jgi:hypothetical protein